MVHANAFLDALLGHDLASVHSVVVFGAAADEEIETPLLDLLLTSVDDHYRNARRLGRHDWLFESGFVRDRHHEAIWFRSRCGFDHLAHAHDVECFRRLIVDLYPKLFCSGEHAVLDDGPIDIVDLTVGDKDDTDI